MKAIKKYAYERTIGTRRIMGTDHPVYVIVQKVSRMEWVAGRFCNSICEYSKVFGTRAKAIAWAKVHDGKSSPEYVD